MHAFKRLAVSGLAIAALAGAAHAAVQVNTANEVGPGGAGSSFTPSFEPINNTNNVLLGLTPTAQSGDFTLEASPGVPILTDGQFGTIGQPGGGNGSTHLNWATVGNGGGAGTALTYALPTATRLSSIVVCGGWNDNGRDQQSFSISYSTDGTTFLPLSAVDFNPSIAADLQSATRVTFTDDTGLLAGGAAVAALRFDFNRSVENGYVGESEIVAYAVVPEPASAALLAVGGMGLLVRRRKA